jgi:GNAT superfamily N-acetyltransferase
MITNIRKPLRGELNHLLDIDLKCFEDNIPLEEWRIYLDSPEYNIMVGTFQGAPVGFIMWRDNIIVRLGVKPVYRRLGIGSKLLYMVENTLIQLRKRAIIIKIPESLCCPGKLIDVSGWLRRRGFRAEKLESNATIFCGVPEDLICFNKRVSETITYG